MLSSKINFSSRDNFYSYMNRINDKVINSPISKLKRQGEEDENNEFTSNSHSIYDIYRHNKQKIIEDKMNLTSNSNLNPEKDIKNSKLNNKTLTSLPRSTSSTSGFFNFKSNLKQSGIVRDFNNEKSKSKSKSKQKSTFSKENLHANELCLNNQTYFYRKSSYIYHMNKHNKLSKDISISPSFNHKAGNKKYFDVNANKNFYFPTGIFANRKNFSNEVEFKERTNQKYLLINNS